MFEFCLGQVKRARRLTISKAQWIALCKIVASAWEDWSKDGPPEATPRSGAAMMQAGWSPG
jgi:hypothetical protein